MPYGDPDQILRLTENRLVELSRSGRMPETITLVPNGEPTLDLKITGVIHQLKIFAIPIAVITNSSLLWKKEVRDELAEADIVSVKVDALDEEGWKKINRPHGSLNLTRVLEGIRGFAEEFNGELITETMLIEGMNDDAYQAVDLAEYLISIKPAKVYLSLPLRPPAETGIKPPGKTRIEKFIKVLEENGTHPILKGDLPESEAESRSGEMDELVNILKVHPLNKREVINILKEKNLPITLLEKAIQEGVLLEKTNKQGTFYLYNHDRNKKSDKKFQD
jgi:wyosine [tRNA(Phe)-imidazoG37] synthetase (radical SAM superfamily)